MPEGIPANVPVALAPGGFPRPFGRYTLEKNLSRGGMGEVFLAIPRGVNARCVIKTIRGDLTGDKEFIGRFADEAKIMMRISHENIIRVFDCGKVADDYYIAMEYVYGRDLGDVLDRAYERGEPMPKDLGLYVTRKLLSGLHYAHNLTDESGRPMRLVHRDISPQNVLIGFDGSVKLIDFGLARTELLPARTQGALAVGKYGYMSPEQARHEKIDGRADIYSTGVMLFEVFTGDRLVDEQDQATLWSRVLNPKHRKPSTVLPELAGEIDQLIMGAVATKPDDRFASGQKMLDFVEKMSLRPASRDGLIEYLHRLYPSVEFSAPAIPDLRAAPIEQSPEKSMIIAMSAEGAKSVFGRGELPVEWTSMVDVSGLRAELARKPKDKLEIKSYGPHADALKSRPPPEKEKEKEKERDGAGLDDVVHAEGSLPLGRVRFGNNPEDDAPTRIAHQDAMPIGTLTEDQTKYERPPRKGGAQMDDEATHHASPAVAVTARKASEHFRDDEMTVMMDAPPRNAPWAGEDLDSDEIKAATKAAVPVTPPATSGPTPVVTAGGTGGKPRAIQEKQHPKAKPTGPKDAVVGAAPAVALRNTVKSDKADPDVTKPEAPRPDGRAARRKAPAVDPVAARSVTLEEQPVSKPPNWLQLGLLLMGLTVVILLIALLVLK